MASPICIKLSGQEKNIDYFRSCSQSISLEHDPPFPFNFHEFRPSVSPFPFFVFRTAQYVLVFAECSYSGLLAHCVVPM
jgi:hypothetical protein